MMIESEIFLQVYELSNGKKAVIPLQTAIPLFIIKYLQHPVQLSVSFVLSEYTNANTTNKESSLHVNINDFNYKVTSVKDLKRPVKDCHLPVIVNNTDENARHLSCVAGLCGVLRQVLKCSGDEWKFLLGFRKGCLAACAEVSLWTRFCEVDIVEEAEYLIYKIKNDILVSKNKSVEIPINLMRFEEHLRHSVRVHNVQKILKNTNKEKVEHSFAECHQMSLADLIIFPCVYIILKVIFNNEKKKLNKLIPLICKWYNLVIDQHHVAEALELFDLGNIIKFINSVDLTYITPTVPAQSLYKSDPKRYRPKAKLFTKQGEVEEILYRLQDSMIPVDYSDEPFGHEVSLNWSNMPKQIQPTVPDTRVDRKIEQLENLAKAVLKVAQPGDIIVDFCCGSGHLGILVAYCLPDCSIMLLDNKEHSLSRGRKKVKELGLTNISIVQCNLDYFKGDFQIGISLHACGVATDLVIQTCLQQKAAFIVCPCCYGSLQDNHKVTYPNSKYLQNSLITKRDFYVLGHCADQVHKQLYEKSEQGERCMAIVDFDRCMQAKEAGYNKIDIAKLVPPTCTPRNNLLVGIPLFHGV